MTILALFWLPFDSKVVCTALINSESNTILLCYGIRCFELYFNPKKSNYFKSPYALGGKQVVVGPFRWKVEFWLR